VKHYILKTKMSSFNCFESHIRNKGDMKKVYEEYEALYLKRSNYLLIQEISNDKKLTKQEKKSLIDMCISEGKSFCDECECNCDTNYLITTQNIDGEKQLCQDCVDEGCYNICRDCNCHHHCDYGITKCNDYEMFDFCKDCYEQSKSEIDEEFPDESDEEN